MGENKSCVIPVSFKKDELDLYYKIDIRCKLISKSGWLKEAAMEKLMREENNQFENIENYHHTNRPLQTNEDVLPFNVDTFLNSF